MMRNYTFWYGPLYGKPDEFEVVMNTNGKPGRICTCTHEHHAQAITEAMKFAESCGVFNDPGISVSPALSAKWKAMNTAPRDKTDVLLYHRIHGIIQGRFYRGEWTEHHEFGSEYSGAVWCFGDDIFQEEVEETPDGYHDGNVLAWQHLPAVPHLKMKYAPAV